IKKNNWFLFGDFQGLRQGRGLNVISTVPTTAQRSGDFGSTAIYDPLTTREDPANPGRYLRTQFPNNAVPASRIPRQARLLANLYQHPNAGTNHFFFSPNRIQHDDAFNTRSEKVIVPNKNNIFAGVSRGYNFTALPGAMPAPANAGFPIGPYAGGDSA